MPVPTDLIRIAFLQEIDGVQLSNDSYWVVDDVGDDPTLDAGLVDVMNAYYDSCKAFMSDKWSLVCAVYENLSNPEGKIIKFQTSVGLSATDCHPQDQVMRINSYGGLGGANPVHRNGFNQSGLIESLSTDGRINNPATVDTLRTFLTGQQIMPGPSWTLDPQVRWQTAPGPPAVYANANVNDSVTSMRLFKLASRKTKLCTVS